MIGFIAACLAIALIAFALGQLVRSPTASVLDSRDAVIPVYAAVESRSVSDELRLQGDLVGGQSVAVTAAAPEGAQRLVVTGTAVEAGTELDGPTYLGAVSGRPLFFAFVDVPLYRDLALRDSGADVTALQAALGVATSGTVDRTTLNAVRALYSEAGHEAPGGNGASTFIRTSELSTLRPVEGGAVVQSIRPVGAVLDESGAFVTINLGSPVVTVRASVTEADRMSVDDAVLVQSLGGAQVNATIREIGEFVAESTDSGRPPGRDVQISAPELVEIEAGTSVSLTFGQEAEATTAVPTAAVRSDAIGAFVLRQGAEADERVDVTTKLSAAGWTAITSEELAVGDLVLVSR